MSDIPQHSSAFRRRRFLNWFPMGLAYAFLYMGRYNLTVAKIALGSLMTKEDFGVIFGAGTLTYAFAFLLNGPMTDRMGGKKALLASTLGSSVMNAVMGLVLLFTLGSGTGDLNLRVLFSLLYALNMYFQSFGAVAIVKVNAHWFHVRERGGFSGIFGTMISSGIFFAFTINFWLLDLVEGKPWVVFFVPAAVLFLAFLVEAALLKDRPAQAGQADFDTGDAWGDEGGQVPVWAIIRRVLMDPVILTVALVEFCTGVLRNGVMHWFPIYAKEVWVLPANHYLVEGGWTASITLLLAFAAAVLLGLAAYRRRHGKPAGWLWVVGSLAFLGPFLQGGWGGLLMVAGVIGGNVAGWVSDLVFQSRRAPAAGGLYFVLAVVIVGMPFALGGTVPEVAWADEEKTELRPGDRIVAVGTAPFAGWSDVRTGASSGATEATVLRGGVRTNVKLTRGDERKLAAGPRLTVNPIWLGIIVFLVSLCVIGTHGLLSGTATMDFGGRKGAATAVGMIDGFVYLGTGVQSVALGYLTTRSWSYWPWFLLPFALIGFLLLTRIWHAKPKARTSAH